MQTGERWALLHYKIPNTNSDPIADICYHYCGEAMINVYSQGFCTKLPIFITATERISLLGPRWIEELKLETSHCKRTEASYINEVCSEPSTIGNSQIKHLFLNTQILLTTHWAA